MDYFSAVVTEQKENAAALKKLMRQAFEGGELREKLLLSHRDWAGPDEGLYAFNNDRGLRQWHGKVKKALGIESASALTRETLQAK